MKTIFHFVSTNILSGLENMVINISTLVKGYDYTYVSPDGPINNYLNKLGIKHISINKMTPSNVKRVLKQYNPNIVQGHDVKASISLAFNYSFCKKKNMKIISELHNDDPRMHKLTLRSGLYGLSSKYFDQIIVVSKSIINNYIFSEYIKNKVTVINNVINPSRIKNSIKYSNNNWDFIFIGRFVKQKDPLSFVKIIYELNKKCHKNITAIMVGEGPLKLSVFNLINKYNLSNNIELIGFQSNPYQYLNESKILLMPSIFEGFGLVALESLVIGVPVIASSVGELKNILNNNCGYLVNTNNEFVNKSYRLLFDNNLYDWKKKNALLQSDKINDIVNFKHLYREIYED